MRYSAYNETVTTVTPAEVKVEAKLFEGVIGELVVQTIQD